MSSMNIDDFIAGILSSMKLRQVDEYPTPQVDEKIVRVFGLLEQLAQRKGVELRFHCSLNPWNNRSATVHYGLVRAQQSGMLKRDGHDIKILLTTEEAAAVINESPLSLSEWKLLTKTLNPDPLMVEADLEQLELLYERKS